MAKTNQRLLARERRQERVRKKVRGCAERPRLCVFRSTAQIYVQVIDDADGRTLAAASSLAPAMKEALKGKSKTEVAQAVGRAIAEELKNKGQTKVIFDRNGFLYHGRVKALAEAAREAGLDF